MRFCAAIHLTSSDTIRDSRGSIENKEPREGTETVIKNTPQPVDRKIENKETPRGDGNLVPNFSLNFFVK